MTAKTVKYPAAQAVKVAPGIEYWGPEQRAALPTPVPAPDLRAVPRIEPYDSRGEPALENCWAVRTDFEGPSADDCDRKAPACMVVRDLATAGRFARAIAAGVAFHKFEVRTDIYGQRYATAECKTIGKYLNEDLDAWGF